MLKGKIVQFTHNAETYFRIGLKYAEKKKIQISLKYLKKAASMEPFNAEYQFNLAAVLAELREVEKSTKILLNVLMNIDPTFTECYFGVACNYFDVGDLKKAREYFEKYIYYDPEGQFAEDAYDILYYMNIYDGAGFGRKKDKTVAKLTGEGRQFLASGKYDKASARLEKAVETDPAAIVPRNELAVVCALTGEMDRAISLTKSVLLLKQQNLFAQCHLAVLLAYIKDGEGFTAQMNILLGLGAECKDEAAKVLETYAMFADKSSAIRINDIRLIVGNIFERFNEKPIKWKKEWEEVIQCALENKECIYRSEYEKELKNIWMNYIKKVYPGDIPTIRKSEVWAAALEYIYCKLHLIRVSKNGLAKKYNISPSSLTNRLRDFSK